ncbi:MAG: aspartyl-tRNA amidotransferase [Dehalococcoidia bacterium]|nr:aspartyl-tRNA amidotransferase [Dehalococcoidia bacterium]|tara:strand:+ start:1267 stop:1716 length:450 start_codon:yes stop_codon:yes gene_type:complete
MALREQLESDIKDAMRSHNQSRLETLRFLKSQIQLVEKNQLKELDEAGLLDVVAKQVKERRESLTMFEQGNRSDLAERESIALEILQEYLPEQLSQDELTNLIKKVIEEVGATTSSDKGKIMGRLMPQIKGKADGTQVNTIVTELLDLL